MLSDTHRFWTMDDTPKDQNQKLLAMWPQLLSTLQNSKESHNNNNKAWNIILGDLENWLPVVPSKFQPFRRSFMDPHVYSPPMNPIFLFFYKVFWLGSRHVFSFINLAPILCPLVRGSFQILAEFWKHCLIFLAKIFWYPLFYCIIPFLFGSRSSLSVFRLHFCPKFFFFFFFFVLFSKIPTLAVPGPEPRRSPHPYRSLHQSGLNSKPYCMLWYYLLGSWLYWSPLIKIFSHTLPGTISFTL